MRGQRRARQTESVRQTRITIEDLQQAVREALGQAAPSGATFAEQWEWWEPRFLSHLACPRQFSRRVEMHLLPVLGELTEGTLTMDAIELHFAKLAKTRAPGTMNNIRAAGSKVINDAIRAKRWKVSNPFSLTKRRRPVKRKPFIPSIKEARRMVSCSSPAIAARWATLMGLGLRPGELRGLKVEDWDARNRILTIRRTGEGSTTKAREERAIPVPDWLVPHLNRVSALTRGQWLFTRPDGRSQLAAIRPQALNRALRAAGVVQGFRYWCGRRTCKHVEQGHKLEPRHCPEDGRALHVTAVARKMNPHSCRHFFATTAQELEIPEGVISHVLGHAHTSVTAGTYVQYRDNFVRGQLQKLNLAPEKKPMRARKHTLSSRETQRQSNTPRTPASEPEKFLTATEAGRWLGVDKNIIVGLIHARKLTALHWGGRYRIALKDLQAFKKRHTIEAEVAP